MRHVLVVDLEASCYKDQIFPPTERSEIVEVGLCLLDLNDGDTTRNMSLYVKPTESSISKYCIDLTGITQELLDKEGRPFEDVCKEMLSLGCDTYPWVSYGQFDEDFFQEQCLRRGVTYPLSFEHYNFKDMVNAGFKDLIRLGLGYTKGFGLKDACHLFDLDFAGRQHSGKVDAFNLARLIWKVYSFMDKDTVKKVSSDGSRLRRRY